MARSRKNASITDKQKYAARLGHRRLRRKVKVQLSQNKWETFPVLDEMINPYDICDYWWKIEPTDVHNKLWWVDKKAKIINGIVYIPK